MDYITTLADGARKAMVLALAGLWWPQLPAQELSPTSTVLAVQGAVTRAAAGADFVPILPGTLVQPGDRLKTQRGAFLDLGLGEPCGTLRLTENTVLRIDKVTGGDASASRAIQLTLERGIAVGFGNHAGRPSQYQIKIPDGLLATSASQFRVDARGYVVVLDGDAILAHLDAAGHVTSDTLRSPPAVYYAPGFGVQTAPPALVHEVLRQATVALSVPEPERIKKPGAPVPDGKGLEPAFEFPTLRSKDRPRRKI